jgi:hypothetical protein
LISNKAPRAQGAAAATAQNGTDKLLKDGRVPQNRTQHQERFSPSDFIQAFGTAEKCYAALQTARWPNDSKPVI